jgi:predicted RNA binding protein YcfA (HicA-like mRNA interferase family)
MADFYRDVTRLLRDAGYEPLKRRGKGSHEIWRNAALPRNVTVPRKLRSRQTANAILVQTGLSKKF